jgi:hypothetical protein
MTGQPASKILINAAVNACVLPGQTVVPSLPTGGDSPNDFWFGVNGMD